MVAEVEVQAGSAAVNEAPVAARPIGLASWLWLCVAMVLALALRIPFFRIPMLADEGGYAWAARGWINGTGHLYDDLWISRPQGIFVVYAGILEFLGTNTIAMRFAAWIAIALTVIAVWGFTRLCASATTANLAAIIFAITSSLPNLEGYSANAEAFMGLPAALAALWLLRIRRSGWSRWQLLGVGVLIGIATSLKPSGVVMLPVAMVFIAMLGDGSSRQERWRRIWPILTGVGVVGLISLFHGWYLGWSDFFYATISYRLTAQSAATVGIQHNLEAILRLATRSLALILLCVLVMIVHHRQHLARMVEKVAALPHISPSTVLANTRSGLANMRRPRNDGRFLLRLWLVGTLGGAAIGGDWWAHYLIQVVAPLSIWLGWTMMQTWPTLRRYWKAAYATASTVLLILPFWVLIHGSPSSMAQAMFSHP
jgi:4-amino-4-deoxy-L-arabinose transferase-like glycosyltransferase